jgi:hypothetical protein
MRCPTCGEATASGAIFCSQCGAKLANTALPADARLPVESRLPADDAAPPETAGQFPPAGAEPENIKDTAEKELWRGGYSPKAMLGCWVASGVISVVLLVVGLFWIRSSAGWMCLLALAVLPWVYWLTVLTYRRAGTHYLLTTQEFVHERGVLRRVNNRIETLDMADIAFTQTLLQRLAGVGDIRILSTDRSDPDLVLRGIENVAQVAELFNNARRDERRRRGLHIEQI